MRYKKKEPAHIEERVVDSRETCDHCGAEIDDGEYPYCANEVKIGAKIGAKIGSFYPDGDSRAFYEIDVCAVCFIDRVVPLLRVNGFPVRRRDADDDERVWDPKA